MSRRYLFGPVSRAYAEEYLKEQRQAGRCLCFGNEPGLDLQLGPSEKNWQDILARLPADWRPDFLVLQLAFATISPAIRESPLPVVGLAGEWHRQWHGMRRLLPRLCDLVLTDGAGVEAMARAGIADARLAPMFGASRVLAEAEWPAGERDIDVLFVGNTHPAMARERLAWLGRLAALHGRWKVVIRAGVFGEEYRKLLGRARIVFNRSSRGAYNPRVCEAIAAGALLFQEAGHRDTPPLLRDGQECVEYHDDDLETLLERYLGDEPERARIEQAARGKLGELTFARQWQQELDRIDAEWPALCERAARRCAEPDWVGAVWQAVSAPAADATLRPGIRAALADRPRDVGLLNALGVATLASARGRPEAVLDAANLFQEAWGADPRHVVVGLNLAEALVAMGQRESAAGQAHRVLAVLDQGEPAVRSSAFGSRIRENAGHVTRILTNAATPISGEVTRILTNAATPISGLVDALKVELRTTDDPLYPYGFDLLRVEWERAAWQHAGDPAGEARAKVELLRWRLFTMLGELTGDPLHFHAACLVRPDLPATRAALGLALAKKGRLAEAVPHLEEALRGNPFDNACARVVHDVLGRVGLTARQMEFARTRRRLSAAAPGLVPAEGRYAVADAASVGVQQADAGSVGHDRLRIVWQGAQDAVHSLALVNRGLCAALAARGHELSLLPASGTQPPGKRVALPEVLAACAGKALSGAADVHVSHQWPPDFTPPRAGRWVIMQPWEFGSIPRSWLAPLRDRVDELWVPSTFVRDCFVKDGVPAGKVHVVPLGVGDVFFRDDVAPYPLRTRKRCKLLFVGGTLPRKGFDLLLKAYRQVFCDQDDVCLVVKDMGVGTFYQGQTAQGQIEQVGRLPHAPAIEYIADELSDAEMAGLYQACDVVVQPYRGEGFCLPAAEAMASGKPLIVTGRGPVLDYATDETAYLLQAGVKPFGAKRVGDVATVDTPFWAEPNQDMLRLLLRYVYEHPEEPRERGARAREHARTRLTWAHAAAIVEARLLPRQVSKEGLDGSRIRENAGDLTRILTNAATNDAARIEVAALLGPARLAGPTGDDAPRYHLNGCVNGRPKLSVTMIVRNEAHNLAACIESFKDIPDEIIVVDTGSTDDTVAIAQRLGAKVFHFPWIDHFAAARNESLRHATGEWVLSMDADDRLDEENRGRLRRLLAELPDDNVAFVFKILCVPKNPGEQGTVVHHVRLFRNLPGLAWEHRIHEQILPALKRRGASTRFADVVVHHLGYQDPQLQPQKAERNLRILHLEYEEQPYHPFTLFNLGLTYREMGKTAEALDFFRRSLRVSPVTDSIVRKLYASITHCERELGRAPEALATCREGRSHYPEDAELLLQESMTLDALNDPSGAIHCLERLLLGRDGDHFASVPTGLSGYMTRHQLAARYLRVGRVEEAEAQWHEALAEQPRYLPAVFGLADVCLARRDWPGLEAILGRLRSFPGTAAEIEVLRARLHLACGAYAAAQQMLEEIIALHPRVLSARLALSHVLLKEGRDWPAAERALRAVLEVDPHHAASKQNLAVLLREHGR